ncbi:MAG: sulfatase-like hydrolase/transferase [Marinilabiliaceae bacterium]|nr:sulfatase-like hydrolase/transferase [Marinilabiliaceae bacterium]
MRRFFTKSIYINEYLLPIYHFASVMVIYSICRVLFFAFNAPMFPNVTFGSFGMIMIGGLKFDVSALIYLNLLYILFSLIPTPWNHKKGYRAFLKVIFLFFNSVGIALNVIDFKYYPFIMKRTTSNIGDVLKNEDNMWVLAGQFLIDYWYLFLIWIALVVMLLFLYDRVKAVQTTFKRKWLMYPTGLFVLTVFITLGIIGIRGGWRHSTRPITLSNAGDYVKSPEETAIVLNTPFSVIRTIGKKSFVKMNYFESNEKMESFFTPVVIPSDSATITNKNVIVLILESFSREHFGCFNDSLGGKLYKGYTPFLDSLAGESLIFSNAYANGRKSIDAMPSVTASLPALVLPYVISEYSSNKVNSFANLLGKYGYESAFWHGAPNGSMGFSAFANMVGFNHYMGKDEFNDDSCFDGIWGIWDEPFLQFVANNVGKNKQPFVNVFFSLSSHHPYKVPEQYNGVFPEGDVPLHKCVGYTDNALRKFFQTASKYEWFKNTLFVITADHSTFPVHDEYKTNINAFAIPLIFYTPDGSLKGVDNRLAQQIDILPTVLSYLDYPRCYISFGNNLLDKENNTYVLNYVGGNYQFMMNNLVIYFDGKKVSGVYNFKRDPYLKNDIQKDVDFSFELLKLKAVLQQYNNRMIENDLVCK